MERKKEIEVEKERMRFEIKFQKLERERAIIKMRRRRRNTELLCIFYKVHKIDFNPNFAFFYFCFFQDKFFKRLLFHSFKFLGVLKKNKCKRTFNCFFLSKLKLKLGEKINLVRRE